MAMSRRQFSVASVAALGVVGLNPLATAEPAMNRRILLVSRPVGSPGTENFRQESVPIPKAGEGEILLRTRYLSLDPYMRGRMNAGKSYADRVELGDVMVGGTVSGHNSCVP